MQKERVTKEPRRQASNRKLIGKSHYYPRQKPRSPPTKNPGQVHKGRPTHNVAQCLTGKNQ